MKFFRNPVLMIITVFFLFSIISCEKNTDVNQISKEKSLVKTIENKSEQFIISQNRINSKVNWKNVMKIAGADLLGVLTGGVAGVTIGTAIPGVGNAAGATIGMIVGGVGGSLAAAGTTSANGSSSGNIGNVNNQYDYIGAKHIEFLGVYDNDPVYFNNEELLTPSYYASITSTLVSQNIIISTSVEAYPLTQLNLDLEYLDLNFDEDDFSIIVNDLYSQGLLTETEMSILNIYFNSLLNTVLFTDFVTYSISVEQDVINSTLPDGSKQILLSTMATSRWDVDYWINANL